MPQLKWNEVDFLDFFLVEPNVDEDGISHEYEIVRDGLRLLLTVWQLESLIMVSLFRDGSDASLFTVSAFVQGEARVVNDQQGHFLAFEDCTVVGARFWRIEAGDRTRLKTPAPLTIELAIDPDFELAFVDYQDRT